MENTTLRMSVVAAPDTASVVVLYESDSQVAPWTLFQVTYGRFSTVQETAGCSLIHIKRRMHRLIGPRAKKKTKKVGHVVRVGITMMFLLDQEGMLPVVAEKL